MVVQQLVPDSLWEIIGPLLPAEIPKPNGGRLPLADRQVLAGIVFVLRTGIPWEYLPKKLGTCRRYTPKQGNE